MKVQIKKDLTGIVEKSIKDYSECEYGGSNQKY